MQIDFRSEFLSRQFIRFLIFGGLSALGSFVSRIYFSKFLPYSVAIVFAYIVGMCTAFVLFKIFVFGARRSRRSPEELVLFAIINVAAVLQTLAFSLLFARLILPTAGIVEYTEEVGHILGISTTAFTSFIGHKYLSFRKTGGRTAQACIPADGEEHSMSSHR